MKKKKKIYLKRVKALKGNSCEGCYFIDENGTCIKYIVHKLDMKYPQEKVWCSGPERIFVEVKK